MSIVNRSRGSARCRSFVLLLAASVSSLLFASIARAQITVAAPYCQPTVTNTSYADVISNVVMGTLSNNSGSAASGPPYTYYNNLAAPTLVPGVAATLVATNNPTYTETIAMWIDWNRDNTFQTTEKINEYVTAGGANATFNFTTPLTATAGPSRLRLRARYATTAVDPCTDATSGDGETEDYNVTLGGSSTPTITTTAGALPNGTLNQAYSTTISAVGGTGGPYTWSITLGALPPGLNLAATTGVISGTPTTSSATPYSFSVKALDTTGSDTKAYTILVPQPIISTVAGAITEAAETIAYSFTFAATGGLGGPYTWSISAGTVPIGLTLGAATGILSGTPASGSAGNYSFTVKALDATGNDTKAYTLFVRGPNIITPNPPGTLSSASSFPLYRSAATSSFDYSVDIMLLSAADLAGIPSGSTITGISYKKTNNAGSTAADCTLDLWLRNTTAVDYGTNTSISYAGLTTGATQMVDTNQNWAMPTTIGFCQMGPFNTPNTFVYSGGAIEIITDWECSLNATPTTGGFNWEYAAYSGNTKGFNYNNSAPATSTSTLVTNNTAAAGTRRPTVRVDFLPPVPTDLDIQSIQMANNGGYPVVGGSGNTVTVTMVNHGTNPLSSAFNLQYTVDGGVNYVTQACTPTSLSASQSTQVFTFTTPWVIASLGSKIITVRVSPQYTGDPDIADTLTVTYTVDADVSSITTVPVPPVIGANQISATIKNNGTMGLNGATIPLQYSLDGGTVWTTAQNFTATTLGTAGSTESFTLSAPWTVAAIIPTITVQVRIATPLAGDPDVTDVGSRIFTNVGSGEVELYSTATESNSGGGTIALGFPTNTWYMNNRMECVYPASELSASGVYPGAALNSVSIRLFEPAGQNVVDFRVRMGHTTATAAGTTFTTDASGVLTVVSGPTTYTPAQLTAGSWLSIPLTTPFVWNGSSNLIIDFTMDGTAYASGGGIYLRSTPAAQSVRGYADDGTGIAYPFDTGLAMIAPASVVPELKLTMPPASNPGCSVLRGSTGVSDGGADNLGITLNASAATNVTYTVKNIGQTNNLTVTSVTVTGATNCTATQVGTVTSPILPNATANLVLAVTPGVGPYSFNVAIANNSQQAALQSYAFDVSGIGFVNTAPSLAPPRGSASGGICITECDRGANDSIEIQNTSTATVDVTGWQVILSDSYVNKNLANTTTWTLSGTMAASAVQYRTDLSSAGANYLGANIFWDPGYNSWAMLVDNTGAIRDFVAWGWTALDIATMSVTSGTLVGLAPGGGHWYGNGATSASVAGQSLQRTARIDSNGASDWVTAAATQGTTNAALTLPMAAGVASTGVAPNYTVGIINGQPLTLGLVTVDPDAGMTAQTATMTVTVDSGSLTSIAAGFTQTFPITIPAGVAPLSTLLTGTAAASGNIVLKIVAADNATTPGTSTSFVNVIIGAALDTTAVDLAANYTRVSGQKDVYRGEQNIPLNISVHNTDPSAAMSLTALSLAAMIPNTTTAITGITFNFPASPVSIAANGNATVAMTMSVALTASGAATQDVRIVVTGGTASNTTVPANPVFVTISAPNQDFKLFDGPAPGQLLITTTQAQFAAGAQSVLYFTDLYATGGSGNYTWSIPASSPAQLPASLTFNTSSTATTPAIISGTPTSGDVGQRTILFSCSDGSYVTTKTLVLVITNSPLSMGTTSLPAATEQSAYSATITGAGGTGVYTYSVDATSQHQLPAALTLNASTGAITGTPQPLKAGAYNIKFKVNDGFSSATSVLVLTVNPGPVTWVGPATMSGKETVAFTGQLSAAGGIATLTYSVAASSPQALPAGLSVNGVTGAVTGAPNIGTAGTFNVTFSVTDGVTPVTHPVVITITVADPLLVGTSALDTAEANHPYTATLAATGGSQVYSFTVQASTPALPTSLTLSTAGVLSGTPTAAQAGRYALTVKVTDSANRTATRALTLGVVQEHAFGVMLTEVNAGTTQSIEITNLQTDSVDISGWYYTVWKDSPSASAITFTTMPLGTVAQRGDVITITSGGTAGGTYPNFNMGTNPGLTSASNIAVGLFDSKNNCIDFVATGNVVPAGLVSAASAAAGVTTFDWGATNITTGSANSSRTAVADSDTAADWTTGTTGTPNAINPGLPVPAIAISTIALATAQTTQAYSFTLSAVGGTKPYSWSMTGNPSWLSLNASTGALSGTPALGDAGTPSISITVTGGTTANKSLILNVISGPAAHIFTVGTVAASTAIGTVIDVPVTMASATAAVTGFQFKVSLATTQLEFVSASTGTAAATAGKSVEASSIGGVVTVIGFGLNATAIASGQVAMLKFRVPTAGPKATAGSYAVNITEIEVTDANSQGLSASGVNGQLDLSDFKKQDVNHNGTVNVQDVQLTVNLILHTANPSYTGQGDVNNSGSVTVADVQSVVNCILNATACN